MLGFRPGSQPAHAPRAFDTTDRLLQLLFRRSVWEASLGMVLSAGCLGHHTASEGKSWGPRDAGGDATVRDAGDDAGQVDTDAGESDLGFTEFPCLKDGNVDWRVQDLHVRVVGDVLQLRVGR
ncbi:MAG: hypothetical protein QM778_16190 [Myxococcales bacterium]